ncbi:MAG: glutamine-hydrolyzing carbamoyl-phosphate synthase small subunit, partial [Thioalkalispiraceae bacterium]
GTTPEDEESRAVFSAGLIIRDLPLIASNWRNRESLDEYLVRNEVVAISDIDTRKLTRILREKGAQNGCIMAGNINEQQAIENARAFAGLKGMDLAKEVTTDKQYSWKETVWDLEEGHTIPAATPKYKVVAYDFGVKRNILRLLVDRNCDVTVVPATTSAKDVLAMNPDGVFLSNGPGDPEPCDYAIEAIKEITAAALPTFGICLGHQLLSLASGAKTVKMKFGHHGANHPVQDLETKQVLITSQNHGFAVDEDSLPENLTATHRSLFDGSLQGVHRTDVPAFSFQGHPEASPGPHDIVGLFDHFVELIEEHKK